ncbi:solute carrier family 22 member 13-like [Anableps anableps]
MSSFGQVLKEVGEFGLFQKSLLVALCIPSIFPAFDVSSQVFMGLSFPHHCNTDWILERGPNLTTERQKNLTIPLDRLLIFTTVEWTDASKSAFCTLSIISFFSLGQMLLSGIAYLTTNWRILQLMLFSPLIIILVIFFWLLPESSRWLMVQGRKEEALKELQRAAKVNKRSVPGDLLDKVLIQKFAASFLFYGLSLNIGSFSLNIYLTQLIFGAVEIPANVAALTLIQHLGRRICEAGFLFFGGVSCLVATVVPRDLPVVVTVIAMIGKFSAAAAFSTAYVYTAELYPTDLRHSGMGVNSMCARLAGILSPLVKLLQAYHYSIPMVVYGIIPMAAGCFSLLLPETLNVELQDHTELK